MSNEPEQLHWAEELHNKYSHLFATSPEGHVLRGIEVEDGWRKPVEEFVESMEWHRNNNKYIKNPDYDPDKDVDRSDLEIYDKYKLRYLLTEEPNNISIFQIKQKFGELRIYVDYPEHIADGVNFAIGRASGKAEYTCEACGKIGETVRAKGWIRILCQGCFDEEEKERIERLEKYNSKEEQ